MDQGDDRLCNNDRDLRDRTELMGSFTPIEIGIQDVQPSTFTAACAGSQRSRRKRQLPLPTHRATP